MSFKIITLTVLLVAQTYARCGYPWITQLPWYPPYPWYPQHPGYLDALGGAASASAASSAAAAGGSGAASSSASSAASGVATADPVYGSNINGIYGGGFVYPGYIPEYLYPGALGGSSAAAAAASSAAAAGSSGAASSSSASAASGVSSLDPIYAPSFGGYGCGGIYGGGLVYPGYFPEYLYPGAISGQAAAAAASSAAAAGGSGAASSSASSAASGVATADPVYGSNINGIYGGGFVYPGYIPEYLYPGALGGSSAAAAAAASSAAAAGSSGTASSSSASAASGVSSLDPIYAPSFGGYGCGGIYGGGLVYPGYLPEYLYPGAISGQAAAAASSAAAAGGSGAASSSASSAASGVATVDPIYSPSVGGVYGGGLIYPGYFTEYLHPGGSAAASSASVASGTASSSASSAASTNHGPQLTGFVGGGFGYNHPAVAGFVAASSSDAASSSSGFSAAGASTSSSTSSASSGADPARGGWVSFGYAPFPGGYGVNAGAVTANSGAAAASSASAAGVQGYPLSSPLYGGAYPWPCGC